MSLLAPQKAKKGFINRWFVACEGNGTHYLHTDNVVRSSTYNCATLTYTGYFDSEVQAWRARYEYEQTS